MNTRVAVNTDVNENLVIMAWAVALSCYISHSAMHRKKADFDPSTNFDETWHG